MKAKDHGAPAVNWWGSTAPPTGPNGTAATWVGIQFVVTVDGWIEGFRFFVDNSEDGNYVGQLWDKDTFVILGAVGARVRATTGNAWQQVWIRPRIPVSTASVYRVAFRYDHGKFYRQNTLLTSQVTRNNIGFQNGFQSTALDPDGASITLNSNANGIDVLFRSK